MAFSKANASDTTKVLFIGNSITYFNDMPFMFEDIANNKGKNVSVSMYAPGGTGFVHHSADPNVFNLLRNNVWDIVVLQPGSGESAGASFPVDTTVKRGRVLLDSIYQHSPCARVYLYQIPYGVPSPASYSTYFSVQTMIRDSVLKMADSMKLQMIPAGECARAYYSMHQNLLLHMAYNDIHPAEAGSFLTASAFYAGIFQEPISGCTFYSTIQPDTANKFFSIVDTVVLNHLSDWRINTYNLYSDFSYYFPGASVAFNCLSSNFSTVLWDFGDGSTSVSANPSHTYSAAGAFVVTLFSYDSLGCVDSISKPLLIAPSGVHENSEKNQGFVFPNPVSSVLFLSRDIPENLSYRIFEQIGNEVRSGTLDNHNQQVDVSALQNGIYLLELFDDKKLLGHYKFIKTTE